MNVCLSGFRITSSILFLVSLVTHGCLVLATDLNNDGKSDLVWSNKNTGRVDFWLGGDPANSVTFIDSSPIYKLIKVGNYLYNQFPDLVLSGGSPSRILPMDMEWTSPTTPKSRSIYSLVCADSTPLATNTASPSSPCGNTSWELVSIEDFDGNANSGEDHQEHDELLWWNRSLNRTVVWFLESTGAGASALGYSVFNKNKNGWAPKAVLDFDMDGKADIIWTNPTNDRLSLWKTKKFKIANKQGKFNVITSVVALPKPPKNKGYQFQTAASLTGDKWNDLIWKDGDNQVFVWPMKKNSRLMKNLGIQLSDNAHSVTAEDEIVTTGDYDGDGQIDLVWRNRATGNLSIWHTKAGDNNSVSVWKKDDLSPPTDTGWDLIN